MDTVETPLVALARATLFAVFVLMLSSGCTAIGASFASLGGAVVGASVGAAAKTGTEYELTGGVARTFTMTLADVRKAAVATLQRLHIELSDEQDEGTAGSLVGRAHDRNVRIRFEAITDVMTRVHVTVNRTLLRKDPATADEILTQLKATVEGTVISASPYPRGPE